MALHIEQVICRECGAYRATGGLWFMPGAGPEGVDHDGCPGHAEPTDNAGTVEQLATAIAIESTYQGRKTDGGWEHDAWTVTLTYAGRTYADIAYRMGTGHSKEFPPYVIGRERWKPTPPNAASVIDSLLSDVSGLDRRFEDWATDYGFDEDSRKAERLYHECLKVLPRLQALLGADFVRFEQAERL